MAKPPQKFVIPPATSAQNHAFNAFVTANAAKFPGLKAWAPQILKYAAENHVDPLYFASVLMTESHVNAQSPDSTAGAIGIGQIMPSHIGEYVPWDKTQTTRVTAADLRDPAFNLRFSAYLLGQAVGNYGYQGAYTQGYNPGFAPTPQQPDPLSRLPKDYLPGVTSPGTSGAAGAGTGTGAVASTTSQDDWVVITPKGGLAVVPAAAPPKNVVKDASGQAYNLSNWQTVKRGLDTIYLAYTGRQASPRQVAQFIYNPISDYQIQQNLSDPHKNPSFYKSPIWQTHAPEYEAVYKSIYGNDANPNTPAAKQAITYAVVHNLSGSAFQQTLRDRADYNTSEEYKGAAAQFRSAYENIYGTPDATGEQKIDTAVRQGLNGDQWTQYLRSQPEYTSSGEFQRNTLALLSSMGLGTPPAAPGFNPPAATATPAPLSATATGGPTTNG